MRIFLFWLVLLGSVSMATEIDCEAGFRMVSASPFPPTPIREWDYARGDLFISPEQFFSPTFLTRLKALGPVVAIVGQRDGESAPGIPAQRAYFLAVRAGEHNVAHVEIRRDLWDPSTFYVEDLFTQNPAKPRGAEHPSSRYENIEANEGAEARGLPYAEFVGFRDALETIIRQAGGKRYRTSGAQDYLVSRLYSSRVGLKPANEITKETLEMLDGHRRYYAKDFPRELWNETAYFRDTLGTAGERTTADIELQVWREYQDTGKLPEGASLYPSPEQPRLLYLEHGGHRYVSFIDTMAPDKPLLQWQDLHQSGRLLLEKEVP